MNDQPLKIKGYYIHYKNKPYKVLGVIRHSETKEEMVHHRALFKSKDFGSKAEWVRPKEMFLDNVNVEGKEVPRFRFVGMTSAELKAAKKEAKPTKPAKQKKAKPETTEQVLSEDKEELLEQDE